MKAGSGELPIGDEWAYELKWDGMRIVAFVQDGSIRLQSTNLLDVTKRFPELFELPAALGDLEVILDGEVVASDEHGRPSFARLQERIHVANEAGARKRMAHNPVSFVVFDVLHVNGHDTMNLPYTQRRELLEQIVEPGPAWRPTTVHTEGAQELLAAVTEQGLEGLVAKRISSVYKAGARSADTWRKIKPRRRQEFVVGGWVTGEGSRNNLLGSLIVGYYRDGKLLPAGRVGSGMDTAELRRLGRVLDDLASSDCPFDEEPDKKAGRTTHWVEPTMVVEVAFAEWAEGANLRHPSYLGQRLDVNPTHVRREPA